MSCPPGITYLHGSEGGSRGEETASESRSSRAEVESSKANSKTSLSSRKENAGKSQPVDLTQVANFTKCNLRGAHFHFLSSESVNISHRIILLEYRKD